MSSIKGVKGFVPLLENTYNTPVQVISNLIKVNKLWLMHVVNIKKKQQYHCEICNRDMKLGGRARHDRSKIHLLNL